MVSFGKRKVGNGAPCFITFEAGPTHSGLDSAKLLVNYASAAGADAIKFLRVIIDSLEDPDELLMSMV